MPVSCADLLLLRCPHATPRCEHDLSASPVTPIRISFSMIRSPHTLHPRQNRIYLFSQFPIKCIFHFSRTQFCISLSHSWSHVVPVINEPRTQSRQSRIEILTKPLVKSFYCHFLSPFLFCNTITGLDCVLQRWFDHRFFDCVLRR